MTEESTRVCFFTDDPPFGEIISRALGSQFELRLIEGFSLDGSKEQMEWCDTILLDLRSTPLSSPSEQATFQLMHQIREIGCSPPIVAMLGADNYAMTRQATENGVYDTVASPPDIVQLRLVLRRAHAARERERELSELRFQQQTSGSFGDLVVHSESMQRVFALARKVAPCDVSVLITGETGTGKELFARAIHQFSSRASEPFVAFSCANLPETLIEDELFGHERGAFTGATGTRLGRFESADRGTLFLDEIGDLALGLQSKLLRVLQQRSFERLGSNSPINVNIRLICATHRNLEEMVEEGTFRSDLFYRLNVVEVHIPPLRERREGIPSLSQHFLMRFSKEFNKSVTGFSPLAMQAMEEYSWPGNVRELENVVQRAVVMAEGSAIDLWHLPKALQNGFEAPVATRSYEDEVREFKRRLVLRSLRECEGNKAEAARRLGITRGYLHRLINQLQIEGAGPAVDIDDESDSPLQVM